MSGLSSAEQAGDGKDHWFTTTHWSVVLAAGRDGVSGGREALETLCRTYWPPLYAYARSRGCSVEEAEDLTQGFFARLLAKESYQRADPAKGRFRNFLLASFKHFLISEWRKAATLKRGGGQPALSLDTPSAEESYAAMMADDRTPETTYEKRWALILMERALGKLREEHAAPEQRALFERLADCVWGEQAKVSFAQVAAELGLSENAVRARVHQLRQRGGELLRQEVAHTVQSPGEVEDELRYLVGVLSQ
jgi:RNA polymerase sigma factor (sigma-70 family)